MRTGELGELAKNQQGNGNARANIERATFADGQKDEKKGGDGRMKEGTREKN